MNALQRLKDLDERRPSLPGEHWMALAAGLGVWLASRAHPSPIVRTMGLAVGTALVGRAASGRDGIRRWTRWLPVGR